MQQNIDNSQKRTLHHLPAVRLSGTSWWVDCSCRQTCRPDSGCWCSRQRWSL